MRLYLLVVACVASSIPVLPARADGDPGTILVIGEDTTKVTVPLGNGVRYKLSFTANSLAVYRAPTSWFTGLPYPNSELAPDTVYTSGQGVFGDVNGDGVVRLDDLVLIRNNRGTYLESLDLDSSGWIDEEDVVAARLALGTGAGTLTFWLKGLAPSAALADVSFQVFADLQGNGTFTLLQTIPITVMSVTLSGEQDCSGWPCGWLGSAVNITITPAIPPLAFDASTTATWEGELLSDPLLDEFTEYPIYVPPPPQHMVTELSSDQLHEQGISQASFIVGDGTKTSGRLGGVLPSGWIVGPLKLHFGSNTVVCTSAFYTAIDWSIVGGGYGAPGNPVDEVIVTSAERTEGLTLEEANGVQYLLSIRIEKNSLSAGIAPPVFPVTLVTYDESFATIDEQSIWMFPGLDDFGPDKMTYYSDYRRPILFVDGYVDQSLHPNLTIVRHSGTGGNRFYIRLY